MKKRFSKTERIGVNKAESIFINDFDWVFREQPILDFGIDAHIEIVQDNPTLKLAGLQIKTGESHFNINEDFITFYLEEEHYEYWTNSAIPILLIAHFPKGDETYWMELSDKSSFSETKTKWKIEIPKTNKLDIEAKGIIEDLIESYNDVFNLKKQSSLTREEISENDLSQIIEDGFSEIGESLKLMIEHNVIYNHKIEQHTQEGKKYVEKGLTIKDQTVKRQLKNLSADINLLAKRFAPEIEVLDDRFQTITNTVLKDLDIFLNSNPNKYLFVEIIVGQPAAKMSVALRHVRNGMEQLRDSIIDFPNLIPDIRKSKRNASKILRRSLEVFEQSENQLDKIVEKIKTV